MWLFILVDNKRVYLTSVCPNLEMLSIFLLLSVYWFLSVFERHSTCGHRGYRSWGVFCLSPFWIDFTVLKCVSSAELYSSQAGKDGEGRCVWCCFWKQHLSLRCCFNTSTVFHLYLKIYFSSNTERVQNMFTNRNVNCLWSMFILALINITNSGSIWS